MRTYTFHNVDRCNMCDSPTEGHRILGQRLNRSQGLRPRRVTGISVSIKQCTKCGLIYSSPQPIPASLQDHYNEPPESYWKPAYFAWDPGYFRRQIEETKRLLEFQPGMRALDIGAGLGKCMRSLEATGFEAHGLEPSKSFWDRAISVSGISPERLRLGMVEELDYPQSHFDFITFGAVFEHLYDPSSALRKAMNWLKPTGVLHLEVPSSAYLVAKLINLYYQLLGTNYVTNLSPMHAPFHLYEFGLRSFQELGERQNFKVIRHYYDVCPIFNIPRLFHWPLRKIMQTTETGMQLTVFLR